MTLQIEQLSVRFRGLYALDEVSLAVPDGSIVGIIGPNGAGKTTLFNVACGLCRPTFGRVRIDGADVSAIGPARRARLGLGRTFQRMELFTMLSVRDNVRVAVEAHRDWSREKVNVADRCDDLLERVGLTTMHSKRGSALTTGQGRMLELARALACRPRTLLLDEPASGQDEHETRQFAVILRELAASGVGIGLIEHDLRLVMNVCDQLVVLDSGRVLLQGEPDVVRHDERVLAAYVGSGAIA